MTRERFMYAPMALVLVVAATLASGCAPAGEEQAETAVPAAPETEVAQEPSYLDGVAWPPTFQANFTNHAQVIEGQSQDPAAPQESPGTIFYDATDPENVKVKTYFEICPALPCVDAKWIDDGVACWFYLLPDAELGYASYVLTEGYAPQQQEQYSLVGNMGPIYPDFAARYNKLLPLPPLDAPPEDWRVPVGNPPDPTVKIQWFQTSGYEGHETAYPFFQGYYAAVAEPQSVHEGDSYKPPYAFGGTAPSEAGLSHGELTYHWRTWNLEPSFGPIELPDLSAYQQYQDETCPLCLPQSKAPPACYQAGGKTPPPPPPPSSPPPKPMSCPVCHATDLGSG